MKNSILREHKRILSKVKEYIEKSLDSKTRNILNPTKDHLEKVPEISEILAELIVTEREHYSVLSISSDSAFQMHLKRQPNSCFINNFFSAGLQAWQVNIDIQLVFNHYEAVTYMCAYFAKVEDETYEATKQAAKGALFASKIGFETIKAIAKSYSTKGECSVQEVLYHILPKLLSQKIFPKAIFMNSNMPEKRYRIFKNKCQIDELPEDSTEIFLRIMLGRYLHRPDKSFKNGKYREIRNVRFSEFLSLFYPKSRTKDLENIISQLY